MTDGFGAVLDVQMSFCVVGAREYAPCQKNEEKSEGFVHHSINYTLQLHLHLQLHYITLH